MAQAPDVPASLPNGQPPRKKSRIRLYWIIGILVVLGGIVGAVAKHRANEKAIVVTTEQASRRTLTELVTATGKIRPEMEVKISPEVAGEIVEIPVKDGDAVKKGDLLVRIKPDNYEAQVEQQEASLASAKAVAVQNKSQLLRAQDDYKRSSELYAAKLLSDAEYTKTRTDLEVAQANHDSALAQIRRAEGQLKQAQDQLEKTTIYSPIEGTVTSLTSEVGERIVGTGQFAGTEVMRISNLERMEVRVNVNENDVVHVKLGDLTSIAVDAYPRRKLHGIVTRIANAAQTTAAGTQQEVTNFEVRIAVKDRDVALRPSMSATADIATQTVENVISVPLQSVTVRTKEGAKTKDNIAKEKAETLEQSSGGGSAGAEMAINEKAVLAHERAERENLERVVFIKTGDTVKLQPVETGVADNSYMEIKAGVQPGDVIISGGYGAITRELKDGSKVRIEPPKKDDKKS